MDEEIKIILTDEEADLLIRALSGYRYIVSDVMSHNEMKKLDEIEMSIFYQLPERLFLTGVRG